MPAILALHKSLHPLPPLFGFTLPNQRVSTQAEPRADFYRLADAAVKTAN
ncbi:hypothetical protein [Microvirga massiliensis]|nr:hypothetical protein [Microvirga massiliensis]